MVDSVRTQRLKSGFPTLVFGLATVSLLAWISGRSYTAITTLVKPVIVFDYDMVYDIVLYCTILY